MKRIIRVPQLETDRLVLRMWYRKDASALFNYARNPDVGPNAGWKPHSSVAESRMIITDMFRPGMTWAITEKGRGIPIGSIGLDPDNLRPNVASRELGYSLAKSKWGKGYMTEAAQRVIRYAFDELKLDILMIRTNDANHRSQRVITKCGFVYEGTLREAYRMYDGSIREVRCHSMLRAEYEKLYLD